MSDAMPDYAFEVAKLERQRRGINVNVLDQQAQLAEFAEERKRLKAQREELEAEVPQELTEGSEAELLRNAHARARAELGVFDVSVRETELDGIESRLRENIKASESAIVDLDERIEQLKEANGLG